MVTVTDTGIGIDPELLPSIFDMFVQIDHGSSRARSGLGIGLALTKRLVELHEGQIVATSGGPGTGATFTVRLPLASSGRCTDSRRVELARPAGRCRVLVAEDIPDAAEMMRLMIGCMGHDVRVAADGVQAVEIARNSSHRSRCSISECRAWTGTRRRVRFARRLAGACCSSRSPGGGRKRTSAWRIRLASIIMLPNPPSLPSLSRSLHRSSGAAEPAPRYLSLLNIPYSLWPLRLRARDC